MIGNGLGGFGDGLGELPPGNYHAKIMGIDFGSGPDRTATLLLDYQGRVVDYKIVSQEDGVNLGGWSAPMEEAEMANAVNLEVFMDLDGQGVTVHEGEKHSGLQVSAKYHYFSTVAEATAFIKKHLTSRQKAVEALQEARLAVEEQEKIIDELAQENADLIIEAQEELKSLKAKHQRLHKRLYK